MSKTSLAITLAGSAAITAPAHAHISMYGPLKDRGGDQKTAPCGGARRSSTPYTFEPGATITLGVSEDIEHDGYFRISFDNDGDNNFQDPKSIDPVNPNRISSGKKCEGTSADHCGMSDFCNVVSNDGGPTVLWDNLNPHLGSNAQANYTWTVKLPDIECDNCTIQVQQVMEDPALGFHGPFDGQDDLYYRCVDIVLKKGATASEGVSTEKPNNKGKDCLAGAGGAPPTEPSSPTGGGKGDAGAPITGDAGVASARDTGSSGDRDAGSKPVMEADEDEDAPAAGIKVDAGKQPTPKVDASTAHKDAGSADREDDDAEGSDEDEDDGDAKGSDQPAATDDGCSVSSGTTSTHSWSFALTALLTTAIVATRRRRSR